MELITQNVYSRISYYRFGLLLTYNKVDYHPSLIWEFQRNCGAKLLTFNFSGWFIEVVLAMDENIYARPVAIK